MTKPEISRIVSIVRILAGLLFIQHGAEKLWGFAGARIDHNFAALRAWGGPIEVVGGLLIVFGLFTRATAFVLCGEMAVAYFKSWAPRGFFPIQNGGEEAVQFCYLYLWMVAAGGGVWSLDHWLRPAASIMTETLETWETRARSVMRLIFGFLLLLHGVRLAYHLLPALAGRRLAAPMPLDRLPEFVGYGEIVAGALLMLGALTVPVAVVVSLTAAGAYLWSVTQHPTWPIRGGGNETLLYAAVFTALATMGGGVWSLDQLMRSRKH